VTIPLQTELPPAVGDLLVVTNDAERGEQATGGHAGPRERARSRLPLFELAGFTPAPTAGIAGLRASDGRCLGAVIGSRRRRAGHRRLLFAPLMDGRLSRSESTQTESP
jgi:hypothetical protein